MQIDQTKKLIPIRNKFLSILLFICTYQLMPTAHAGYELEVCQYVGTYPPGLDESLKCDHNCFIGDILKHSGYITLHELYSIGWRLIKIIETDDKGSSLWTVYIERKKKFPQTNAKKIMHLNLLKASSGGVLLAKLFSEVFKDQK